MNFYFVLILAFLISVFILDTLADLLNVGRLKTDLPNEFKGIYDSDKYSKSIRYQKENVYFEFFRRTTFLIVTITFFCLGGFNWVDHLARQFQFGSVVTGLIFTGLLIFLRFLLQLPFSIYDTFGIEAKYGFNKTTPKTFILDLIKGAIIGTLLGGLILSGMIYFFEQAGSYAWLYAWLAFTAFQITLMYLAPAVIMPLFNKFKPLSEGSLKNAIENYAKTRQFKLSGIFTMDSSLRTTKANAFFTGFGRFRRLVLFDTLIEKQTEDELVAVLAHEIGHFELKHIIKTMVISLLSSGFVFFTFSLFLNNSELFAAFQMENVSVYASLLFIGFLYSPVLRVLSIFSGILSRKHEFEADRFAVETYGKAETLISALKKLSVDSLSHLDPHPLKVALDYSHPPILQRIAALRKL